MNILLILIVSILFLCICNCMNHIDNYSNNLDREEYYSEFMKNYKEIFPEGNRNAGGPMFYKHINQISQELTEEEFHLHHSFYCGVSGSVIQNQEQYDYIKVKGIDGNEYYGKYYRCCWPCSCDIMRDNLVLVEDFTLSLSKKDSSPKPAPKSRTFLLLNRSE